MPAASAMSRTVVFLKPRSANSPAAMSSSSSRRVVVVVASGMLRARGDDLTGEVRRVVTGEEDHHVGHLPGFGCPTERLTLLELGEQLVGGHLGQERVHRQAGRDGVDADAVG